MSSDGEMDKEAMVHIYNGILLSINMNETMLFAETWMDLEIVILSEVSQTEKGKHHTISILCRILKMVQMSLCTEQK